MSTDAATRRGGANKAIVAEFVEIFSRVTLTRSSFLTDDTTC